MTLLWATARAQGYGVDGQGAQINSYCRGMEFELGRRLAAGSESRSSARCRETNGRRGRARGVGDTWIQDAAQSLAVHHPRGELRFLWRWGRISHGPAMALLAREKSQAGDSRRAILP